ncbi:MAG: HDOD domain-containing protein [Myxococcota bacterium]
MRRVLFVDDDPRVLEMIRDRMRPHIHEWETAVASSGIQALSILAERSCDVVVTDMRLPKMTGDELLRHVKARYPATIRMILAERSELEQALSMMSVAHQFLSKPFEASVVRDVLYRSCALNEIVGGKRWRKAFGGLDDLPARPQLYFQLMELLALPKFTLQDVASIVSRDRRIAERVVEAARHSSHETELRSLQQAVAQLGTTKVRDWVLAFEVQDSFREFGIDTSSLDHHAVVVAQMAQAVAPADLEADAFLAGLMHDVGHFVLAVAAPSILPRCYERAITDDIPIQTAESSVLGLTHAEAGAYLLGLWGLPQSMIDALVHHHDPSALSHEQACLTTYVHVADCLSKRNARGLDLDYLNRINALDRLRDWQVRTAWIRSHHRATRSLGSKAQSATTRRHRASAGPHRTMERSTGGPGPALHRPDPDLSWEKGRAR